MRLGIVLAGFTALPAVELIAAAREAEARGYHTAWLGEVAGYDAIVMSTVVATHTERLVVANGVLPVQTRTRHPGRPPPRSTTSPSGASPRLGCRAGPRRQLHGLAFSPPVQIRRRRIVRKVRPPARNPSAFFGRTRLTGPAPRPVARLPGRARPRDAVSCREIADGGAELYPAGGVRSVEISRGRPPAGRTLAASRSLFRRTCVTPMRAAGRRGPRHHVLRDRGRLCPVFRPPATGR